MNNQEDKKETLDEILAKPVEGKVPYNEDQPTPMQVGLLSVKHLEPLPDPFSDAAIRFRAGEDAVYQSILDAPHLRDMERAKEIWPKLNTDTLLIPTHFVNPFSEQGKAMIDAGQAVFDLTTGSYVKKSYLDEIYGKPKRTPPEQRNKIRNSCISGHMPGEEKVCPWCRQARFYTITSGYYQDIPELEEVETILRQPEQTDDRKFVLEYLELPEDASKEQIDAFLIKMVWIEKLTTWAKRTFSSQYVLHPFSRNYVPLAPPYQGKSGVVASLIIQHEVIRDIYASAIMVGYEEFTPPLETERFLKQFDRPGAKGKTESAKGLFPPEQRQYVVQHPRRVGRATLNAAIAATLSKQFVGVDPATDPAKVVVLDSLSGLTPRAVGDTHGYITNKVPVNVGAKRPPSKLVQALMQRFNKKG